VVKDDQVGPISQATRFNFLCLARTHEKSGVGPVSPARDDGLDLGPCGQGQRADLVEIGDLTADFNGHHQGLGISDGGGLLGR